MPLIDGGVFDWVGQLAANRKFRYIASAMGTQLTAVRFRQSGRRAVPMSAASTDGAW
jgi:hypothetical protein